MEPIPTALLLSTMGVLLLLSVLLSRATARAHLPVALVFLVLGILAGSEGIGGIEFEDYAFAYRVGTVALVLILFDGGFNTSAEAVRRYLVPAGVLATVGVVAIALLVAVGARMLGIAWPIALLLGAVVSSTDAAAVFAVLRGSSIHLKHRVGATLEVESGINDPMAVILTTLLTQNLLTPGSALEWGAAVSVLVQFAVGLLVGAGVGFSGRAFLARLRLPAGGLYPVLMLALAFMSFGLATLLFGSGFLAVFVTAVILGNGPLPYRAGIQRVHDALAWLSQILMFLILGLLVFPSRLAEAWQIGLILALFLAFVARPLVVWATLLPFRYPAREVTYIGWTGLRGAVPIILAIFPVLLGAPGATRIFDTVFFIVVVSTIVPGATVAWMARRLGLESREPPAPQAVLTIESMQPLRGELMSFYIEPALAVAKMPIAELPFPEGSAAALIVRGDELIAPKGGTILQPGDHVFVFSRPDDLPFIQLMFGRPEARGGG